MKQNAKNQKYKKIENRKMYLQEVHHYDPESRSSCCYDTCTGGGTTRVARLGAQPTGGQRAPTGGFSTLASLAGTEGPGPRESVGHTLSGRPSARSRCTCCGRRRRRRRRLGGRVGTGLPWHRVCGCRWEESLRSHGEELRDPKKGEKIHDRRRELLSQSGCLVPTGNWSQSSRGSWEEPGLWAVLAL